MDEDLTMEERRSRWRMVEMARRERGRKKRVEVNNRELQVKGRRWIWSEERRSWEEDGEE